MQVFQLAAISVGGSSSFAAKFRITLKQVAICREVVESVNFCLLDFVRDPSFTQRISFSDSGVAMLEKLVANVESVFVSEQSDPW